MKKMFIATLVAAGLGFVGTTQASTAAQTKNPIVLVPGIFAFDTIATIDYWYKIPQALQSQGARVYVPKINAFNSSTKRGEELIAQLENIRASSGGTIKKFNLIGHSQGGMTTRYVMNARPDLVASVTTLHTPHKGAPMADVVTGVAPGGTLVGMTFDAFANTVGNLVNQLSKNPRSKSDIRAMLAEFNKTGAASFNSLYPAGVPTTSCGTGAASVTLNGNPIKLYSWSGTSKLTNALDASDALFGITALVASESNDGVTGRCSSHFGTVLRDNYNMNHLDANNHILGLVSLFEANPKTLLVNHASRLKNAGL